MDRKYWALVIPALEPDFVTAVRKLEDRGLAGVPSKGEDVILPLLDTYAALLEKFAS